MRKRYVGADPIIGPNAMSYPSRGLRLLSCCVGLACLSGCMVRRAAQSEAKSALFAPVPVVFLGDSITYFWGPGQSGKSDAFTDHKEWLNAGAYGETSGQMLNRFRTSVIDQKPAMVHILAGTNDVYPGWVLCGGVQSVDTCGNIKAMTSMAQAAGIEVILGTIPPWGPGDAAKGFDPSPERFSRIDELNHWIVQYASEKSLTIVDYHGLLASSDGDSISGSHDDGRDTPRPAGV